MKAVAAKSCRRSLIMAFILVCALAASGQPKISTPTIPPKFNLDFQTAAHLRPQLMQQTTSAAGYTTGRMVFERLVGQIRQPAMKTIAWELRIIDDDQLNAYSSPDGTIYVDTGLAAVAGQSAGLWAAILSHEIAHVTGRDWARRYLYQKSLENQSPEIVLGDPGWPSDSWTEPQKASEKLGLFCRQMEIEADREGLMLMASAGFHPDFVPALHHLLHAHGSSVAPGSLYPMHPCWEERDRELSGAYTTASIEFEHRWPERYATPGGNPPVVVFAEPLTLKKTGSREWEVQLHLRCQNLVGAIEVVILPANENRAGKRSELRQLTGCTSPRTTVSFTLSASEQDKPRERWRDVYVLDAWGAVLARSEIPGSTRRSP